MKGYHKLRVGEKIKEGDVLSSKTPAHDSIGQLVKDAWCREWYRPITKKARKVKKFNLEDRILNLVTDFPYSRKLTIQSICRFIRRNYRRKE